MVKILTHHQKLFTYNRKTYVLIKNSKTTIILNWVPMLSMHIIWDSIIFSPPCINYNYYCIYIPLILSNAYLIIVNIIMSFDKRTFFYYSLLFFALDISSIFFYNLRWHFSNKCAYLRKTKVFRVIFLR